MGIPLGPYVIVRLLPVEGGEPHYRVRSSVDGHERALLESISNHVAGRGSLPVYPMGLIE